MADIELKINVDRAAIEAKVTSKSFDSPIYKDMLQEMVDETQNAEYLFYKYKGTKLNDYLSRLDFNNVTNASYLCSESTYNGEITKLEMLNAIDTQYAFNEMNGLKNIGEINLPKTDNCSYMLEDDKFLETIGVLNIPKATKITYLCCHCDNLQDVSNIVLESEIESALCAFRYCKNITKAPKMKINGNVNYLFGDCEALVDITNVEFPTNQQYTGTFSNCKSLKAFSPSKRIYPTDPSNLFSGAVEIETIENIDFINNSMGFSSTFSSTKKITNLYIYNIKSNLQIGSETTYGHLLTLDSLINTCKECIKQSASKNLTMGSSNLTKIANVYVKFIDSSVTSIATGEKGDVEVCESTDEGAMTLSQYMTLKNWVLK